MPGDNIDPPAPAPAPAAHSQEPRWALWILVLFAGAMLIGMLRYPHIINSFADPAVARGAITFLIGVATIGIAFTLIYQAFYAPDSSDDRFRRGREIFAGMMGILGTIVGFYFGSTDRDAVKFEVADIRIEDSVLRTHVAGGTPPFKYSIASDAQDFVAVEDAVSVDGWIRQGLSKLPAKGTLFVQVTDSKGRRADADIELPIESKALPLAPPTKPGDAAVGDKPPVANPPPPPVATTPSAGNT